MSTNIRAASSTLCEALKFGCHLSEGSKVLLELSLEGTNLLHSLDLSKKSVTKGIDFLDLFIQMKVASADRFQQLSNLKKITEKAVHPFLEKQCHFFSESMKMCFQEVAHPLFNKVVDFQSKRIDKAIANVCEKLNQYRAERTDSNQLIAALALEKLQYRVTLLTGLSQRCMIAFGQEQQSRVDKIQEIFQSLEVQILPPFESPVCFLNQLNSAIGKKILNTEQKKSLEEKLDERIQLFSQEMQNALDEWVYNLSPEPKGGENWGKLHRFDDLQRLRDAFCQALVSKIQSHFNDPHFETAKEEISLFYTMLHRVALGPDGVDPAEWAQKELPYLVDLFKSAMHGLFLEGSCDELSSSVISSEILQSDDDLEFNSSEETPSDEERDSVYSSRERKALDILELKLFALQLEPKKESNNNNEIDLQADVNSLIDQYLSQPLRDNLFMIAFKMSGIEGEMGHWGTLHSAEYLSHLIQAIEKIKKMWGPPKTAPSMKSEG